MFFFGAGWLGLVLMIPALIVFLNPGWVEKMRVRNGFDVWLALMITILVVDLASGSFLFAVVQGGLLWWYLAQRRAAGAGGPARGTPPGPPPAPASWYPDPAMRHAYRWSDGRAWSAAVRDGPTVSHDPIAGGQSLLQNKINDLSGRRPEKEPCHEAAAANALPNRQVRSLARLLSRCVHIGQLGSRSSGWRGDRLAVAAATGQGSGSGARTGMLAVGVARLRAA